MATAFEQLILNLQSVGFFRFFLPFVFILAVTYGILRRIELFEDQQVDGVVATAVAFIALLGIYSFGLSSLIIKFLGVLSVALVIMLGLAILAGMMGVDIQELQHEQTFFVVAAIIVILLLIIVFAAIPGLDEISQNIVTALGSEPAMMLYTIVGVGIVIYWITGD